MTWLAPPSLSTKFENMNMKIHEVQNSSMNSLWIYPPGRESKKVYSWCGNAWLFLILYQGYNCIRSYRFALCLAPFWCYRDFEVWCKSDDREPMTDNCQEKTIIKLIILPCGFYLKIITTEHNFWPPNYQTAMFFIKFSPFIQSNHWINIKYTRYITFYVSISLLLICWIPSLSTNTSFGISKSSSVSYLHALKPKTSCSFT